MRTTIVFALVFIAIANGINGQSSSEGNEQNCIPGSTIKVDCNTCICSEDGSSLGCTRMACPPEYPNPSEAIKPPQQIHPLFDNKRNKICAPGTMRMWECNHCRCSSDGTTEVCTRRVCPIVPRNRRDVPFRCVPNQIFMQDCNRCFCSADGQFGGCTLMACPPKDLLQNRPTLVDP